MANRVSVGVNNIIGGIHTYDRKFICDGHFIFEGNILKKCDECKDIKDLNICIVCLLKKDERIDELEEKVRKLEKMMEKLWYAPGMPGYEKTKTDFNSGHIEDVK